MPSKSHGQRRKASRKGHDKRNQLYFRQKHPESASVPGSVGQNSPPSESKSGDGNEVIARAPGSHHLAFEKFLSLPLSVMANTCKFLCLEDLITLSRTCMRLRALLMSKISKPCWDGGRWLQNIPEWKGVAAPRAAAFLFDVACQGRTCDKPAPLSTFYVCKRYCQTCGPEQLLSAEQVLEKCPGIPPRFINLLPWSRARASKSEGNVDIGHFVLQEDVKSLQRRLAGIDPDNREALSGLETELGMRLKQSGMVSQVDQHCEAIEEAFLTRIAGYNLKMAKNMEAWIRGFEGKIWHADNARFVKFVKGLRERWGWDIKRMPQVTNKRSFDKLLMWVEEVPELNQSVWDRAETIIRDIIAENKMLETPSRRPWGLTKAVGSGSSSGPTALLLGQ